jgi:hypothetical protein
VRPSYGSGGGFYGGGSRTPYRSGGRSPGGISPIFFATPFLLFPGLWLYGAYRYRNRDEYTFFNATADPPRNQTKPVECLCGRYEQCGCDDNTDRSYLDSLIGNGSYAALNKSLVNVAQDDGRSTIIINGTLPNGTVVDGDSAAVMGAQVGWTGYCIIAAAVVAAMYGL